MRRANVRAAGDSIEMLFNRPPEGWSSWDAHRTQDYKTAIGALHRAASLPQVIECAKRVAPFYGIDPRTIG